MSLGLNGLNMQVHEICIKQYHMLFIGMVISWYEQHIRLFFSFLTFCPMIKLMYSFQTALHKHLTTIRFYMLFFNSLTPGKFEWNFRYAIFKRILVTDGWGISCEIALIWMSLDFAYDQSTLVQVMACCRQATSHYLRQCWPRSVAIWRH